MNGELTGVGEQIETYFSDLDKKYPNRHKQIHKGCCKNCPSDIDSKTGVIDPESKDIKDNYSKDVIAKEMLFVCAWRNSKLCKGLCDYMEIDQSYLDSIYSVNT